MTRRAVAAQRSLLLAACLLLLASAPADRVLDGFEEVGAWEALTYPGTSLEIAPDVGREGGGMRLDFDFRGARGYVLARRPLRVELPENYAITFWMRAAAPVNTLEFKLVDAKGENVWWRRQRNFGFPIGWTRIVIRKSQLAFAWGSAPNRELREIGAVEIAISASTGGRGSIWIDDLRLETRVPTDLRELRPKVRASSSAGGEPEAIFDGDPETAWRSAAEPSTQWLELDFRRPVEYGGLAIDWGPEDAASAFRVLVSDDAERWSTAYRAEAAGGARSYVALPDEESRHLRLELLRSRGHGYEIREIRLQPPAFSESPNRFFEAVAREAPRGDYPRTLIGEQSYWTVIGVDGGLHKALLDEDGRLEVAPARFTLEPFLYADGELVGWSDVQTTQELVDGCLPIPSVIWQRKPLRLRITAFAAGSPGSETLYARYRVSNTGGKDRTVRLFLAIRPFQVKPPWQSLNLVGGAAPIEELARLGRAVAVDRDEAVVALTPSDAFGALAFESGSLVELLRSGRLPDAEAVSDPLGYASGAFRWDLDLRPGETREVWLAVPFGARPESIELPGEDARSAAARLEETTLFWRERLARIRIQVPEAGARLTRILRSSVAYIFVNRSGPAIQPGARDYARSWIRDGALISAALLEMGYPDEVRDFLRWYARYQYDDGRIPCCVDARGADPVAEHDSNGEFIYAITNYYRHTGDRAFLEEMWPQVVKAVAYIRFLREQTMTPEFQNSEALPVYGLAPQSISHEGYSAHPVHSYWDDFFLLRGLKDAVAIAQRLGDREHIASFTALRDGLRTDLYASISRAIERHDIDFIPGSVELGDFDPTSTSIAIWPGGELRNLPRVALDRTFERYFAYFLERRAGEIEWQSYTPYELRNVATLIRLGRKRLALDALDFFVADQRPAAWNEWAEVVWRDPRTPAFIGDMPHAWVGSGFIRSLRTLFVYEREADRALVIGAGIPRSWVDAPPGLEVDGLSTTYGSIGYSARRDEAGNVRIALHGDLRTPPERIVIESPYDQPLAGVSVDGQEVADFEPGRVSLPELPAEVVFRY